MAVDQCHNSSKQCETRGAIVRISDTRTLCEGMEHAINCIPDRAHGIEMAAPDNGGDWCYYGMRRVWSHDPLQSRRYKPLFFVTKKQPLTT